MLPPLTLDDQKRWKWRLDYRNLRRVNDNSNGLMHSDDREISVKR